MRSGGGGHAKRRRRGRALCGAYILQRGVDAVLDGLPLHFFKQGDDGDGHIGGQKQREGKTVENFLVVFAVNLLPLRDRCEQAHTEQRSVREQDRFGAGS